MIYLKSVMSGFVAVIVFESLVLLGHRAWQAWMFHRAIAIGGDFIIYTPPIVLWIAIAAGVVVFGAAFKWQLRRTTKSLSGRQP
jgi:hypothetical protein